MVYCIRVIVLAIAYGSLISVSSLLAHGGGLDAKGGHTDRSTGQYHCHRAPCSLEGKGNSPPIDDGKYDRDDWSHWLDEDGDCLNTRHEVLLAQSIGTVVYSSNGCRIHSGLWSGPYTGKIYQDPSDLDIDHVIPLAWAHAHGAAGWSPVKKAAFANDPLNLLAVDDGLNQSKGAKGLSEWLPPQLEYVCDYLMRWLIVMSAYPELSFSDLESMAVSEILVQCR